jgi:hypothetical protein
VQHVGAQPGEAPQGAPVVEVGAHRHRAGLAHAGAGFVAAHDADDPEPLRERPREAQPEVAAAEHDEAGPPEAPRQ